MLQSFCHDILGSTKLAFNPPASATKDQGPNPHMGRTFLDRYFKVTTHSHAQLLKRATGNFYRAVLAVIQTNDAPILHQALPAEWTLARAP
jgi:hypothetical protein